jgi:hypothetical protein
MPETRGHSGPEEGTQDAAGPHEAATSGDIPTDRQSRRALQRSYQEGPCIEVVPQGDLDAAAEELARRLLAQPQPALRLAKRALTEGQDLPLTEALYLEARLRSRLVQS